jgi:hypothetical protein
MRAIYIAGSILAAGLLLSGCDNNTTDPTAPIAKTPPPKTAPRAVKTAYTVTLKNLTYAQPMAPMAVAYHSKETSVFKVGTSASLGLEKLAEDGDNSMLLTELSENSLVSSTQGGTGLVLPGKSDSVTIEGEPAQCISVTAMLVNTNDAFAGVDCINVSELKNGEMMTIALPTYDAGTENNSEEASTIPGPAGGGEGFNADRDDKDFVSIHAGAVTQDDGLSTSALTQNHKWNNPATMLTIERIK